MADRRFHLGIDYGTSASKIVVRDYGGLGGERAYVVTAPHGFRMSSTVLYANDALYLGPELSPVTNAIPYESVKMRVAEEAIAGTQKFHYGPKPDFPPAITARDMATISVWWLISIGHRAAEHLLKSTGGGDLQLGMTLGVPMSFMVQPKIRDAFLTVAMTAWRIYRRHHLHLLPEKVRISVSEVKRVIDANTIVEDLPSTSEDISDWIRSETEAAMWWAFQSPAVSDGPFAQVDIGAGTTNASLFRIYSGHAHGHTVKDGLAFLGSCSEPAGMDAVNDVICSRAKDKRPAEVRGTEETEIERLQLRPAITSLVRDRIWEAYRKGWIQTFRLISQSSAERKAWDSHRVILTGGGNLVNAVRDCMPFHPAHNGRTRLPVQNLEFPRDLYACDTGDHGGLKVMWSRLTHSAARARKPQPSDLPFVAVAYGLSNIGIAIPPVTSPSDMPPMPPPSHRVQRLASDDIYAK